ncbi:KAT8 regulatory NSL complex subunit 3-like [Uranotaenia lowii]|uniref:KAT8 regulatory NSL complex subunit 3-like n=1 Tax=Uranotaenia lowii TaxID=190385 RepID=UPI0024786A98|nr:KAT8 regulatory NSL complex subunit 3-like [Uranotaenia lowii]
MEHSYSRDFRPMENSQTATTRTLMVHRPPQCPSCHTHGSGSSGHDEGIDLEESYNPPIPSYNEESAKIAMLESENVTKQLRNCNSEDVDWEDRINKLGWSVQQIRLFSKVTKLLDMDRLARLTIEDKQHEPVHRRMVIDKSVGRLRQALASVSWEPRLTQWIHGLLMESLPPSYLAAYIDILQTLKAKLPTMVDKMIFGKPLNISQELVGPILKKPWEPIVAHKNRKLPGQPFIMVVPSGPNMNTTSSRLQKWYALFATMASVIPILMPHHGQAVNKQSLQTVSEQLVAVTRAKIQEVRQEAPNRPIILVGFNAGAALAIQIGLVEPVNSVVCLGFAYNTVNGPRGAPDDHITDITAPVLFVVGQMSAKTSQEEIEHLREKMVAQTSLVVVGSADDCLRVCKSKRKIEGVTQSMVDNMIMDEVAEFATNCLLNPPRPKQSIKDPNGQKSNLLLSNNSSNLAATGGIPNIPATGAASVHAANAAGSRGTTPYTAQNRKRKMSPIAGDHDMNKTLKMNNSRVTPKKIVKPIKPTRAEKMLLHQNQKALDAAIQSILPEPDKGSDVKLLQKTSTPMTNYQISSTPGNNLEIRQSSGPQVVSGLGSSPIVLPMIKRESITTTSLPQQLQIQPTSTPSSIKVIPSNQFIQLKPSNTTQKFISFKSSPKPVVSIVPKQPMSTPSPLAKTTQISPHQQQSFSPTKFTIVRNNTGLSGSSTPTNAGAMLRTTKSPPTPDLSNTNIFDIPIVFADNEGNIQEGSPQKPSIITTKPSASNIVTISSTIPNQSSIKTEPGNRIITLQPSLKPNKVVIINKNNIKQVPANVLTATASAKTTTITPTSGQKFTKVVLSNPLAKTIQSSTPGGIAPGNQVTVTKNLGQIFSSGKLEILNSTIVKPATVVSGTTTTPGTSHQKYQPIIINVDPSKTTTMKNFVRVGETQIRPVGTSQTSVPGTNTITPQLAPGIPGTNTILIKTNSLSHFNATRKPTILNRNITVRKVNIVPGAQTVTASGSTTLGTPQQLPQAQQQQHQQHQAQQQPKAP